MKSLYRKVDSFDGQTITINGKPSYELGSFLGGGAAGVVYEGADVSEASQIRPVAIKILNPVGFRLAPAATLRRCVVARRGQQVGGGGGAGAGGASTVGGGSAISFDGSCCASSTSTSSAPPGAPKGAGAGATATAGAGRAGKLGPEHVWWLVSPNTKQVLAAYMDPRYGSLVELPLPKCIEIWGLNPTTDAPPSSSSSSSSATPSCYSPNANADVGHDCWSDDLAASGFDTDEPFGSASGGGAGGYGGAFEVQVDGMGVSIPWLPPKYVQWLSQRRKVKREINNMGRVGGHRNVLELLSVLELLQDSKSTLFLILELVTGGELLDHIRLAGEEESRAGAGGRRRAKTTAASALRAEGAAQRYFFQLLSGLAYCHRRGVCHRDLSPSNLLLAESPQGDAPPELKVADFGLSACCGCSASSGNEKMNKDMRTNGSNEHRGVPQRVRSVVGSPYYMAPEVASGSTKGYDGFKADAWSCGVVLYTMLTQSLPFDRELSRCPRYKRFKSWAEKHNIGSSKKHSSASTGPVAQAAASSSSSAPQPHHRFPPHTSSPLSPSSSSTPSPSMSPASPSSAAAASGEAALPSVSAPVPPLWLFPPRIPAGARALLVSLLVPNPSRRMSVEQALSHPWLAGASGAGAGVTPPVGVAAGGAAKGPMPTSMSGVPSAAAATAPLTSKDLSGGGGGGLVSKQVSKQPAFRQPPAAAAQGGGRGAQQQQQQRQQQQKQRLQHGGGDVFATAPPAQGGRRGSMPVWSPQEGRLDAVENNNEASGNGRGARANDKDKAFLLASDWGRPEANADIPRELIPSTTSFP
eukprot:g13910.t1